MHYILEIVDNGKWISEDRLKEIQDNLFRKDDAPVKSIGLHNVYTRLHFFYGKGLSMEIRNNEEAGVKISVIIPKEVGLHV
ncbi:hypothetical protein D3C76_1631650 [compost metagenome]